MEKALDHRKGGNGRALGRKKAVGDLIPEVSILIKSLIKLITDRIRDLASILYLYLCLYFSLPYFFIPQCPREPSLRPHKREISFSNAISFPGWRTCHEKTRPQIIIAL